MAGSLLKELTSDGLSRGLEIILSLSFVCCPNTFLEHFCLLVLVSAVTD